MIAAGQPPRRLHFDLHGDMQDVMQKVKCVEAFSLEAGCSAACAQQLALVAEEIFANIVGNAWSGRTPGRCSVEVAAVAEPGCVRVSLQTEDDGIPFDPLSTPPPDLDAALDDRPIGGLGILLIKTMTDDQNYRRVGEHNILQVSKACNRADSAG